MKMKTNRTCLMSLFTAITALVVLTGQSATLAGDGFTHDHSACLQGKLERYKHADAYSEETGEDLRNFPPDRIVDYLHMRLEMRFEDLNEKRFTATQMLRVKPIGSAVPALTLDAAGLEFKSVTLKDKPIEHFADDTTLTMRFDPPLKSEQTYELHIEYSCDRPVDGMFFTPLQESAPHYTAEVHTQGQPESNHHWFPCHDYPNERLSTELIVDVPAGHSVSSNGELIEHSKDGSREVWHYLNDKSHVNYLVSLIIGKFAIVKISPPEGSDLSMQVWVPEAMRDRVEGTYGRTGEMIEVFEDRFGVEYPWARYDQLVAKNFGSGGMENTSVTTMYPTAIFDDTALADRDLDSLIAHELAHQWTGDLITCKSWADIWLNEGWATYGSALWFEHRDGKQGYLDSIRRSFRVARWDDTSNKLPMVSPIYEHPWEVFRRAANPYPKGSSILHMLRMMLGEDVFWQGVHTYMNRHAYGVTETHDFRYALEEASGRGLAWFFDQWCYRPGTPALDVNLQYDGKSRRLTAEIKQTQQIDARTPAFEFTLPIFVRTDRKDQTYNIKITEQTTSYQARLDSPPTFVAVDPNLHVLKTIEVDKPHQWWMAQAGHGPTIAARHEAVEALAGRDTPEAIDLLAEIIRDDTLRYTLRNTAVDSLSNLGSGQARDTLLELINQDVTEPRVRKTLVSSLKILDKEIAIPLLADFARTDSSYATRVAAIEGLAEHEANDKADLIVDLIDFPSQHDQVRTAALRALAELNDPRGLEPAIKYAAYGYTDRSRSRAIGVIADLAEHDKDKAVEFLLTLLNDPERRNIRAAGSALAQIGDKRANPPIQTMAESHPGKEMRDAAKKWLKTLKEKQKENKDEEKDQGRQEE